MRLRNSAAVSAMAGLSCALSGRGSMPRLGAPAAGPSGEGAAGLLGTRPTRDPGGGSDTHPASAAPSPCRPPGPCPAGPTPVPPDASRSPRQRPGPTS